MTALSPGISRYLDDYVARLRRVSLVRATGWAVTLFLGWMILCCLADRFIHLPMSVRMFALGIAIATCLTLIVPKVVALWLPTDLLAAAGAVEQRDSRFQQRLVTVASRSLGAADYRGSDEILSILMRQVGQEIAAKPSNQFVSPQPALLSWFVCMALVIANIALLRVANLRYADLAIRFLNPLTHVPAVTTTQLAVSPGDLDIVQSQPLVIRADVSRLGDSSVILYLQEDQQPRSRMVMTPAGGGSYTCSIAAVDRDIHYYITGGDARSPDYTIRVLRRPVVAQFKIHYDYPAYTRLPPMDTANSDGRIEAPAGSKVLLTVVATEPLQAALLTLGNDRLLMEHGGDPFSRQASFVLNTDVKYSLDLISTREVAGTGPDGTAVRALPDLPPQVRLARAGDSLRLNPRDIVPVWYEALDDYGLASLAIRAQVNGQEPVERQVKVWGDPRRQQDVVNFDLATLPLGMGDVVSLTMSATDTAGHSAASAPLEVIISPRSVDLDAYERISELRDAVQLAQLLGSQFEDATKAQNEADGQSDRQSPAYLSANSRADRAFSAAAQTATLLRQALLRATTHSGSALLSVGLAQWIDTAEIESAAAEDAFRLSGAKGGLPSPQKDRLRDAIEQGRALLSHLTTVQQGEQATALLADVENLHATQGRPVPKDDATRRRWRETIERMRQDIGAEAGRAGFDANAGDLENQLRSRVQAAQDVLSAIHPIDFASAAREWAVQLRRDPQQRLGLEGRLSAAAQAEAICPDADLIRARDLELESRAAAALTAAARVSSKPLPDAPLAGFVHDIEVLAHVRDLEKDPHRTTEAREARGRAIKAQDDLARRASDPLGLPASTHESGYANEDRQKEAENLAMQASAAAASHQYGQAAELDSAMVQRLRPTTRPEGSAIASEESARLDHQEQAVAHEMSTARRLDELDAEQQKLTGQVAGSSDIAGKQQNVAEQIAQVAQQQQPAVISPNGRDRAASEVLAAQEQLSALPQALAAVQTAAASQREAAMRQSLAQTAARTAPPDQRDAAKRAAEEAAISAQDAENRLTNLIAPVSQKTAGSLADRLEPFAPETDAARAIISTQLASALATLEQTLKTDDATAVDRAANAVRQAIEASQRELSAAQDVLVRRDPLTAAKWFARAAADSLTQQPPDLGTARNHQANASAALSRAWDQSIHRAATERLAAVPSIAAVLNSPAPSINPASPQQSSKFAAAREWGRLHPQDGADLNNAMHESEPSGYEESLKLYFEALGKAQDMPPGR